MKRTILNVGLVALALCMNANGYAQKIRTAVGTNSMGYSGDGAAANHATIGASWGVVTDFRGNMFVADDDYNVIRKITPNGTISTLAGLGYPGYTGDGGPATNARLNYPSGLATDKAGNLYVADNGNFCIRKIDTFGIITTYVGDGSGARGNSGDGGAANAARLAGCISIAFDKYDNLYIADGNGRVRKVNNSGIISTFAGSSTLGYSGDGGAATASVLNGTAGVATDTLGNVYISDQNNNVIRKVNSYGIISTFSGTGTSGFSGDGGAASSAHISMPAGLAIDKNCNLYIADEGNNRIRKVSSTGVISSIAGDGTWSYSGDGGTAVHGQLKTPSAICLNNSGNLFIADRGNYTVREVVNPEAVVITTNPGTHVTAGTAVTYTVPKGGSDYGLTYQWVLNGHNTGTNSSTYTPTSVNNGDVVACSIIDPDFAGAMETSSNVTMTVTPLAAPILSAHNIAIEIALYPNPNQGSFDFTANVQSQIDEYVFYGVYDITGKLVYGSGDYSKEGVIKGKIDLAGQLTTGQYTLFMSAGASSSMVHFEIRN